MADQNTARPQENQKGGTQNESNNNSQHGSEQQHDEVVIPELKKVDHDALKKAGFIILALFVILFLVGFVPHLIRNHRASKDAEQLTKQAFTVQTAKPKRSTSGGDLSLPGDTRAWQSTSMYPRTTGYLKTLKVDIGDRVTPDQLLAEIESPEVDAQLNQAQAALKRSQDDSDLSDSTLQRYEGYSKTGGVTRQQLDERRTNQTQSRANLAGAKAAVQQLTDLQGFQKIKAPFPGVVSQRNYDIGALLSANNTSGKPLFQLDRVDTLRVFVNVPQSYVTDIHIGAPARFIVRNYPGREFSGQISRTANALDMATRTLNTEVDVPNQDGALFAGMYGQVKFALNNIQPLIIPTSAIIFDAAGTRVATVADGKVHYKNVVLGRDFGTDIEVAEGLSDSDDLITNPGQRIHEGLEVNAQQQQPTPAPAQTPRPQK